MTNHDTPEVWLRGPVDGVPKLLQPVAHGLLQCREELRATVGDLSYAQIWRPVPGVASIGFHLRHAARSLDRLLTYARGESLSSGQFQALAAEADTDGAKESGAALLAAFNTEVEAALQQLEATSESALLQPRGVGRAQLPSTTLGLLFHAAEHTQRHVGQIVTTAKIVVAAPLFT
jgi:uncharacterized damage-inducible protein DinB